jgi:hypothetical protein
MWFGLEMRNMDGVKFANVINIFIAHHDMEVCTEYTELLCTILLLVTLILLYKNPCQRDYALIVCSQTSCPALAEYMLTLTISCICSLLANRMFLATYELAPPSCNTVCSLNPPRYVQSSMKRLPSCRAALRSIGVGIFLGFSFEEGIGFGNQLTNPELGFPRPMRKAKAIQP